MTLGYRVGYPAPLWRELVVSHDPDLIKVAREQHIRARLRSLLFRECHAAKSDLIESLNAGKYRPGQARDYMSLLRKWRAATLKAKQ